MVNSALFCLVVLFFQRCGLDRSAIHPVRSTRSMVVILPPVLLFRNRVSFASSFLSFLLRWRLTVLYRYCTWGVIGSRKTKLCRYGTLHRDLYARASEIVFRYFFTEPPLPLRILYWCRFFFPFFLRWRSAGVAQPVTYHNWLSWKEEKFSYRMYR